MPKKKDSRLARAGVSGFNKPKRTPNHPKKSHVVVAKVGSKIKTIRFGQQGVRGAGKNPKSAKDKARRKSYYARPRVKCQLLTGQIKLNGRRIV